MPEVKKLSKKQKAMSEAAAERMKQIWEDRKHLDPKFFPDAEIFIILQKVYMAGWKQNRQDNIVVPNQLSVQQGLYAIRDLIVK
jgi:hypothetical protein